MAVFLPTLRLSLLLLNIYGTFKAMKPPPQSQRSFKNKKGPSSRAMQLRKRELKSYLAVWVVWAAFSTIEGILDRTTGLITPFYNELKCSVLIFLLVTRAHGAEAIFLHLIHPMLRPYAPVIDDILVNLHLVSDLLLLMTVLPFEYMSHWWHRWIWGKGAGDDDGPPNNYEVEGAGEASRTERRQLRPRNELQKFKMIEANRQAQIILQDMDDAQRRVSHNQALAVQDRSGDARSYPPAVGLRARRKMVLEHLHAEKTARGPGSRTTGVHHFYSPALDELPHAPSTQPFPLLPNAPKVQPTVPSSNPLPVPPQPSSYEIWHPPQSAFEGILSVTLDDTPQTPLSPLYPPFPSAYPFTPRLSDPLPAPPRLITASNLITPTPRRASAGAISRSALDTWEATSGFPYQEFDQTDRIVHSENTSLAPGSSNGASAGRALEPAIQVTEVDVASPGSDDSSNANEKHFKANKSNNMIHLLGTAQSQSPTAWPELQPGLLATSDVGKGQRETPTFSEPLRRSTRRSRDKSSDMKTDEFGFTIRSDSSSLVSSIDVSTGSFVYLDASSSTVSLPKKPLSRTKPALNPVDESQSSDEESEKKRPRLDSLVDAIPEDSPSAAYEEDGKIFNHNGMLGRGPARGRGGKRKAAVKKTEGLRVDKKPKETPEYPTRTTRSSKNQPVSAREDAPAATTKRGKVR